MSKAIGFGKTILFGAAVPSAGGRSMQQPLKKAGERTRASSQVCIK